MQPGSTLPSQLPSMPAVQRVLLDLMLEMIGGGEAVHHHDPLRVQTQILKHLDEAKKAGEKPDK